MTIATYATAQQQPFAVFTLVNKSPWIPVLTMVKQGAAKQKKLAEMVAARGLSPSPLFYDRFSSGISLFYYRFSSGIHCFMIGSHSILVQPSNGQRSYGHVPNHRVPFGHIMCTHAPRDHASWGDMHDKQAPGYNASVDRWWVQRTVTAYPYASNGTTSQVRGFPPQVSSRKHFSSSSWYLSNLVWLSVDGCLLGFSFSCLMLTFFSLAHVLRILVVWGCAMFEEPLCLI